MESIIQWVTSDGALTTLFSALFAVMIIAQLIVNLTPTPKDDILVGKVYKIIEKLAGIWGYKAKLLPGEHLVDKEDRQGQ